MVMQVLSRFVAFSVLSSLLFLSLLGADDKEKATQPKEENKKTDLKKEETANKEETAKKEAQNDEPAKKDADKKDNTKKMPTVKLLPRKGKFKDLETDKEAAAKKMLRKATLTATVVTVVEDRKSLRLRLTIPYVRINEGQLRNYYNAQNLQQMLQAQARLYELATAEKEVELTATDDVKVRTKYPPPKFDDKGRPKPYTRKELQELKGNDKLPGFPAEFSDLKAGQIVEVTLLQDKK